MLKVFQEAYMASLGIVILTHEKALEISEELIEKSELSKDMQQKFTTDLLEEARKNTYRITKIINKRMKYIAQKEEPIKEKKDKLVNCLIESSGNGKAISRKILKKIIGQVIKEGIEMNEKQKKSINDPDVGTIKTDEEKIRDVLGLLNIPTKEDLREIEERLDILIRKSKERGK